MSTSTFSSSVSRSVPAWHAGFLRLAPAISRNAHLAFRNLRGEAQAEAVQEVMANSIVAYVELHSGAERISPMPVYWPGSPSLRFGAGDASAHVATCIASGFSSIRSPY